MKMSSEEQKKCCGMKKPLFDDITVMCVNAFHMFWDSQHVADLSLFQTYFAGFLAGVTGVLTLGGYFKTCRECDCDRNCDECDIADKMRVHFLANAIKSEYDRKIQNEMNDSVEDDKDNISDKIL